MHPVDLRHDPARRLAAVPHRGPYPEIGRAFQKLSAKMATRGLFAHAGAMVAVYYDDPSATALEALRSHAGFEIRGDAEIAAPLEVVDLPATRAAVLTHTGPYARLQAAYDQLYGIWLPASGETPADLAPYEVYLNTPMDTASLLIDAMRTGSSAVSARCAATLANPSACTLVSPLRSKATRTRATGLPATGAAACGSSPG